MSAPQSRSSMDHLRPGFLRPSEQLDVELAAREQHVVECFAEIGRTDRRAAIPADAGLRGTSHQLLDEGGADALGPPDGLVDQGFVEPQSLAVELNQLPSAGIIRQRNFNRL